MKIASNGNNETCDFSDDRVTDVRVSTHMEHGARITLDFDVKSRTTGVMVSMTLSEARKLADLIASQLNVDVESEPTFKSECEDEDF